MTHNKDSIVKTGLNLAIACILSGTVIAGTYAVTSPVAAQQTARLKEKAMQELVPEARRFQPVAGKNDWFAAYNGNQVIAYVVPAESKGYGGTIKMIAAVAPAGTVIDYKIIAHNETPGLGDRAGLDGFRRQFRGKKAMDLTVAKPPDNSGIQAITGATITSKAVTAGLRNTLGEVKHYTGNAGEGDKL